MNRIGNLNPIVFTRPGSKLAGNFVTITPRGGFLFSSGFVHAAKLIDYTYCVLAYDKNAKAILLLFTSDNKVTGAIKVTHRVTKNSSLQSSSFFRYFQLSASELNGRYPVEKQHLPRRGEWFVIFLDQRLSK